MRKHVVATALSLVLVLAQLLSVPSAQAAPGDFLSKWGARHYVPDAAGVAVDKEDNVLVTTPDSVQVFDRSGVMIRKWGSYGSGDGQFSSPGGIAVDTNGNVYVADSGNSRIQVFDSSGAFLWKWADSDPSSIATDGESVYVLGSESIRLYDNHGTLLREFGGCDDCLGGLDDLTLTEEGLLYVFSSGDTIGIAVFDGAEVIKRLGLPGRSGAITVDPQGKIYIAGRQGGSGPSTLEYIRIYDSELQQIGTVYEEEVLHNSVRHMAVDSKGNIFLAGAPMRVLDSAGNPRWIEWPQSLATDTSGNVYVVGGDFYRYDFSNKVEVFSSRGQLLRQWTGNFCETAGIAVDAGSYVHVTDYGYYGCFSPESGDRCCYANTADVFDSSGNFIRQYGVSSFSGALAIDINGRFLVAAGPGIDVYDSEGNFITCFSCPGERDDLMPPQMRGIAVDRNGNIFVTANSTTVQVYDRTYGLIRTWGVWGTDDGQFRNATGIAVDGMGHVFVADSANDRVQVFDEYGNFLLKWGGSGSLDGQFSGPHGVLVDKSGAKVYVADRDNHRIQVFEGFGFPATPCTMSGTVRQGSPAGSALAGATVSIAGRTATTDSTGAFSFTGLDPGTYTLSISMPGYVTTTITEYVLDGDRTGLVFYLSQAAYTVSGAVHEESASGAPVAGATVSMGGKTATSDHMGTFVITGMPGGTYTVTISKPGYFTKTVAGHVVNSNSSGLLFHLTPAYSMSGTVRQGNSAGPLLPAATISIAGQTVTTGSTGTFSIAGILGGTYTLTISKTGYATKTVTGFVVNGNQSGLSFYLAPLYSMSGTVRQGSATGPILAGATVAIAGKTATTSSTGAFSITGIAAGTYTLTVSRTGYATKTVPGCVINRSISGAIFYLSPAYSMSGTVRQGSATGPVLAGARVVIAGKAATTSSTGTFSITGIPAGTYTLTISRTGFVAKTVSGFVVNGNKSGLVFFLSPAYSMSGTVRHGSATGPFLAGATVAIAGKSAVTSSTGTFSIAGIPAGTYTLTISRSGYATKTVTGWGVSSNKSGVVFYLTPAYSLSGTVRQRTTTGPVLAGATVAVAGKTAVTGSTGAFSITGIPAGTYTVTVSKAGYTTKRITGYVINSNKSGLVFFLSPAYATSGTTLTLSRTGYVTRTITGYSSTATRAGSSFS